MEGEPLHILLVEDNPAHAEIVIRNFESYRIANQIIHVEDGQQALDYLRNEGIFTDKKANPLPHVVFLDLRLPKIDGIEVLKTIKSDERLKILPVIILTTSETEIDIARAYGNFANSYLVKPIDFIKFSELMDSLGYYWLAWNRFPR
jgi:CheY-like chemotaxis protein